MDRARLKSGLVLTLKLGIVATLLVFMAKRGFLSAHSLKTAFDHSGLIIASTLLMLVSTVLGFLRWQYLLDTLGIEIPLKRTLSIAMMGSFFNVALPGAVSGDLIKAILVAKEIDGVRAKAFSSIFFDRVLGVSVLLLMSGVTLLASSSEEWAVGIFKPLKTLLLVAGLLVAFFYVFLFGISSFWDPFLPLLSSLERRIKLIGSIRRIYEGLLEYQNHPMRFTFALLLTTVIHTLIVISFMLLLKALGVAGLSTQALFVVVPLGIFVSGIPILPAGVGTGHAAFAYLFFLLGSKSGADAFNFLVLFNLLLGAVGGFFWLRNKKRHPS